ncbi:putative protein ycf45, partial [Sesamum angolense]
MPSSLTAARAASSQALAGLRRLPSASVSSFLSRSDWKLREPLLWKQIGLNSWRLLFDTSNEIGGDGIFQCFRRLSRSLSFAAINSNRRPHLGAIINQKNSNSHGGDIAAVLLLRFCPAAAAAFCSCCCCCSCCCFCAAAAPAAAFCSCCCCILLLLMVLLHYYSAAAAAFRPAAAAATLCCCVLLLLQLRFANAAAVFCCCCSLLRGSNPMVLTGSLAWEGTNSHNCGLIISSIKTNSTKEISNHDQVTLDLGRLPRACYLGDSGKRDLRKKEVSIEELEYAQNALGEFGGNNRTGIAGTLHRISAIKNKNGKFGRPGVGKATVIYLMSCHTSILRELLFDTSNEIGGDGIFQCFRRLSRSLSFAAINSNRRPHLGRSSTRRIRTATEETLRQFCCCTFVLLLLLNFCAAAAPAAAVLLLLLLHFASAEAAAALLLCCRCCVSPCCCCSYALLLHHLLGKEILNCGLIISSIKTNSTKEISNHDQVTLDLGRLPRACYLGDSGKRDLRKKEVSIEELEYAQNALGEFGGNNRTGIAGTLHRISAIKNKNGKVVGLTCRLGRPVREIIDMTRDLLENGKSILFLGRPGVGKATVIVSHVLSYEHLKRVIWRSSTRRIRTATEETLRQFCCCTFVLLLLNFCAAAAPAAAVLLLLLLHFASADGAAALLLCCRCCVSPCCCCSYALLLRFATAAAAFCYCCSCVLLMLRLYFAAAAVCFVEATP